MKKVADAEMAPIQRTIKKPSYHITKSFEGDHITLKNLSKYELKKKKLSLLHKGPKFTPTTKASVLSSTSDIFNLTRRLELEEILPVKEFNEESIVYNKLNKQFKIKGLELEHIIKETENIGTE